MKTAIVNEIRSYVKIRNRGGWRWDGKPTAGEKKHWAEILRLLDRLRISEVIQDREPPK